MTPEQVREVVRMTIDEFTQRKLLTNDSYQPILKIVEKNLYGYFDGTAKNCINISHKLNSLSDDPYIDIIYLLYRDCKTLEWIAEYYDVSVITIKRNKKRLIYKIHELLEEL